MIKTIVFSTDYEEITVNGLDGKHTHIKNNGPTSVFVATTPGIVPGADNVLRVCGGEHATLIETGDTIYITGGEGVETIIYSNDDVRSPF